METLHIDGAAAGTTRRRFDWGVLGPFAVAAVITVARFVFPDKLAFFTEASIYSLYTLGNNILLGYLGYLSFGQPFYLSMGAYTAALYFAYVGTSPIIAMLLALASGIALSAIFGSIFMRLKGSYFTLVNAALCAIGTFSIEKLFINVTKGNDGLWFRARMAKLPLDIRMTDKLFIFVMALLIVVLLLYRWMDKSALGAVFKASKVNGRKMKFLGYNAYRVRVIGFTLATMLSTLAGSLYAINFGFVNPNLGENSRAIEVQIASLLGGIGTVYGPLCGAFGFLGIKDFVSKFMSRWEFVVGIITILVVFFAPKGIWGFVQFIGKWAGEKLFGRNKVAAECKEK